ncbi:hypothetical protein DPMN_049850 [Dreissena polymorpha]|uniref:Uncharacterized protein n=1 Tax=Dreissena polymorpha TaxID=45954 RepID=A0A9D4HNP7_DREPO|nr:hypothetical protein DPMN_049850 [Dreissena polymorpha]
MFGSVPLDQLQECAGWSEETLNAYDVIPIKTTSAESVDYIRQRDHDTLRVLDTQRVVPDQSAQMRRHVYIYAGRKWFKINFRVIGSNHLNNH